MNAPQFGNLLDTAVKKTVYYSGTSTIYEGMPVCYNFDTTSNILGWSDSSAAIGGTTAEGYQNEGKYLEVEDPSAYNLSWFAGVVAAGKKIGATGPCWIDIYIPGSVVPVRSYLSSTVGVTMLAIRPTLQYFTHPIHGGDTACCKPVGLALETVDRSSTAGLCLAYISNDFGINQGYGGSTTKVSIGAGVSTEVNLQPNIISIRSTQTDGSFTSLRVVGEIAGAGGACPWGILRADLVVSSTSQGTPATMWAGSAATAGVSFRTGAVGTGTFVAMDLNCNNNDSTPATDTAAYVYGLQIRFNMNGATAETGVIKIDSDGTDDPNFFVVAKDNAAIGAAALSGDVTFSSSGIKIPIKVGSTTYYLAAQPSL
jgi:hypothetical protein